MTMQPEARDAARKLAALRTAYAEVEAAQALRDHFQCLWSRQVESDDPTAICVMPDGCVDLLWIDGQLRVVGPDRIAMTQTLAPRSSVVGLRFQSAAASQWLGVPMSALLNARVKLEDLWGLEARRIGDWIGEAHGTLEVAERLQLALAPRVGRVEVPDPAMRRIFALCASRDCVNLGIGGMADELGMSERTLRRRCHHEFGYGPKTLERILRFQRFLKTAGASKRGGIAGFAADAGYADQAHLSREVRELCGEPPRVVIERLGI